ncbi:MAG: Stk1 family PASTA domain-containing Ser/Thr kinase [Eubacteriales bacterium]|nr:Stk1 family PASTA domain-containing Ser/Thr kinase [Eubacteriales bacterium]
MIQPGTILAGRYEILNHIGSGGMADVYRALCHQQNRYVAIKILRQEHNEDEEFVTRFIAEAQATAGFTHPNIVNIYGAGEEQGYHYIVMELCEGMTLKRYIRRYGRLSVRETVDYAKQITRGIQAAHKEGIVHRDIKPQNILVSESGTIKVADFGIAKAVTGATVSENLMGSVHYFSPEQAKGGYSDERSDIYSLGITMYEMATGKVPFDGETPVAIALKHLNEEMTPPRCYFPDIPTSLEKIILKCTKKRTLERYQNAQELLDDLEMVFASPEGNYVVEEPMVDDSPTYIQPLEKKKPSYQETEEIPKLEKETEDSFDEDESMQEPMRKMIYVIIAVGGILLALILIYLVGSSLGILHFGKHTVTTETTTEASTEAEEKVYMPNVLKRDRMTAEKILKDNELKASFIYEENVKNNDTNLIVVKQEFDPGETLAVGTSVELTLGLDPEASTQARVEVPPLIDLTEEKAEEKLAAVGLKVDKIYATSDSVKPGYVMKQSPLAGMEVDAGFVITITVSKGVSQVRVPLITGLTKEEAQTELRRVGLNLGEVTSDYNGSVSQGEVFDQGIAPGTMVDRGTEVSVVISLGEPVSYHYEGQVTIEESPFEEGETGSIRLALEENGVEETIYSKNKVTSANFPLHNVFEAKKEGMATVIIYVNGEEYGTQQVKVTAVAD